MVKVYVNTLSWRLGVSTDYKLQRGLRILHDLYEDIEFVYPQSKLLSLRPNLSHLVSAVRRRVLKEKPKPYIGWELFSKPVYNEREFRRSDADIVYSQGIMPANTYGKPVLLSMTFMDLEASGGGETSRESDELFARMKEKVLRLSRQPGIFEVRSDYSLKLISEICPDNIWKFRNLPFLLPSLKAQDDQTIRDKHINGQKTIILFCGAQSRRKGLPILLEAYKRVRDASTELHIVSSMSDGMVELPAQPDIINHGPLPYDEAQKLFRAAHIYAMPSVYESFGLSYVEAQSAGAIVLARDYEPQREICGYGMCGVLALPNVDAVEKGLRHIMSMSPIERVDMALKAKRQFLEKYEFRVVAEKWRQAIIDCAKQKRIISVTPYSSVF